jgi:hypothetical protein
MNWKGLGRHRLCRNRGIVPRGLLEGLKENTKYHNQDHRCLGRDSNLAPPEYESRALPPHHPARPILREMWQQWSWFTMRFWTWVDACVNCMWFKLETRSLLLGSLQTCSVCSSFYLHEATRDSLDGFSWNLILENFRKSYPTIYILFRSDKLNDTLYKIWKCFCAQVANILSRVWVIYKTGFGLVIGFIDHSLYNHS